MTRNVRCRCWLSLGAVDSIRVLPQRDIQQHHDGKAEDRTHGRQIRMAAALRFGNDFLDDDKDHGPGGKTEGIGQERLDL